MKHVASIGQPSRRCSGRRRRSAFSLVEVILALAILAGSIAVLGEVARFGIRNARAARDLTQAQFLCQSKLAELTSGIVLPESVTWTHFELADAEGRSTTNANSNEIQWNYAVSVAYVDAEDGLLAVTVTVRQDVPVAKRPIEFSLVRWMPDPEAIALESAASDVSTGGMP